MPIQEIEKLRSKLHPAAFSEWPVLGNGRIPVEQRIGIERVLARLASRTIRRELIAIGVKPFVKASSKSRVGVTDHVGKFRCSADGPDILIISAEKYIVRNSTIGAKDTRKSPVRD